MTYHETLKQAIKEEIERVFGEIDNCGCYNNGEWMSTESIFEIVCDTIDEHEWLFGDDE